MTTHDWILEQTLFFISLLWVFCMLYVENEVWRWFWYIIILFKNIDQPEQNSSPVYPLDYISFPFHLTQFSNINVNVHIFNHFEGILFYWLTTKNKNSKYKGTSFRYIFIHVEHIIFIILRAYSTYSKYHSYKDSVPQLILLICSQLYIY